MSLAKMSAFFARGPNQKWQQGLSCKSNFFTRAPKIMYEYTFCGEIDHKDCDSDIILTLRHHVDPKIQDGHHPGDQKCKVLYTNQPPGLQEMGDVWHLYITHYGRTKKIRISEIRFIQ